MALPQDIERPERDRGGNPCGLEEWELAPRNGDRAPPGRSFEGDYHYEKTVFTLRQSRIHEC
jgi:hypothetical protein